MSHAVINYIQCPICRDSLQGTESRAVVATQCGHIFCSPCLTSHRRAGAPLCPVCRAVILRTIKVTLREDKPAMLSADAVLRSTRLLDVLHDISAQASLSAETLKGVAELVQAFADAVEASNSGPTLKSW
ncbi:hypothetical protein C8T65DRAFT_145894 [Cerioporus squamosus]|nr:hypothetical protein C8T65DRAFT_145894 [Cerioporus squamosus]